MKGKPKSAKANQMKPNDHSEDRVHGVVDGLLARLTELQPTQELGKDDNGESGDFARQALEAFREGVAKTAKDTSK
jgi:hypothetical protein